MVIVHVIVCVALIAIILLQAGRGHGLAGSSFGSEMNTVFGTKTAAFMTRATSTAAILFLVTCLGIDVYISRQSRSLMATQPQVTPEQMQKVMQKLKDIQAEKGAAQQTPAPAPAAKAATPPASNTAEPAPAAK